MSEQDMLFDESGNLSQSSQINTCKDEPSRWKILIVDDEDGMHTITKLALNRTQFDGKGLIFFSAYNVAQAKEILSSENDIAVVLLDVVMETEEAGLEVAEYIRDVQGNHLVRIILRTGQPGTVPEKDIIEQYDIND
ncbi:response regulator, partial [Vibrio gazogenes]